MVNATSSFTLYPEMSFNVTQLAIISDHKPETLEEYYTDHVGLKFYGQSSKKGVSFQ